MEKEKNGGARIISGSKDRLRGKEISAKETKLHYSTTGNMSQNGMDDEEKGGGTEEMANKMASIGIV